MNKSEHFDILVSVGTYGNILYGAADGFFNILDVIHCGCGKILRLAAGAYVALKAGNILICCEEASTDQPSRS